MTANLVGITSIKDYVASLLVHEMLNNRISELSEPDFLYKLFHQILTIRGLGIDDLDNLINKYVSINYPSKITMDKKTTARSIKNSLLRPEMSWYFFCRGISILEYA